MNNILKKHNIVTAMCVLKPEMKKETEERHKGIVGEDIYNLILNEENPFKFFSMFLVWLTAKINKKMTYEEISKARMIPYMPQGLIDYYIGENYPRDADINQKTIAKQQIKQDTVAKPQTIKKTIIKSKKPFDP